MVYERQNKTFNQGNRSDERRTKKSFNRGYGSSKGRSGGNKHSMSLDETKNLLQKILEIGYTQNVTFKLLDPQVRFKNFLNSVKLLDLEVIMDIIKVILKASTNPLMEKNFRELLTIVLQSEFSKRLEQIISVELKFNFNEEVLRYMMKILKLNFELIPGLAYDVFNDRVHQLNTIIDSIQTASDTIGPEIIREFEELKELAKSISIPKSEKLLTNFSYYGEPPDDFRNISILPSTMDLIYIKGNEVFLRQNKVHGGFKSVDHYLDVQFRLMREDFIQPLREGLSAYKNDSERRQLGLRVYKNVHLMYPVAAGRQGIIFNINFDVSRLKGVKWRQSKRFIFGTLLCLSSDNFSTLLFATVANRDPGDLEKGILSVKIYEKTPSRDETYTMLETTNMFESYRHVLSKLQDTNEETLCMKKYLVYVKEDIGMPNYLVNNKDLEYTFKHQHMWPGVKDAEWPRGVDLDMDDSQYQAFKSALTKEIVIIQGPPGTGKTFLGLNVCECLIKNVQNNIPEFGPILVVCYTNHALDQFLEGISEFTDKIVRIGNRCKSEKLQKFSILELKKGFPSAECTTRKRNVFKDLDDIKDDIIGVQAALKNSFEKLIDLDKLRTSFNERTLDYFEEVELKNWLFGESFSFVKFNHSDLVDKMIENLMHEEIYYNLLEIAKNSKREVQLDIDGRNDITMDRNKNDMYINQTLEIEEEDIGNYNDEFNKALSSLGKGDEVVYSREDEFTQMKTRIINMLIKNRLANTRKISSEEANNIGSLDNLSINDRWRLYRLWSSSYSDTLYERSKPLEKNYDELSEQLSEINFEEDRQLMKGQSIIGMTTTGAARYGKVLSALQCKIIIIEEAAEVLESHIIGSLNSGCEHLILIGDHKQLRPNPSVYELAKRYNLDISLFERLINNRLHYSSLTLQHRMRPEIAEVMKFIYKDLKNHDSVLHYPDVPSLCRNVYFIDHEEAEQHSEETMSYSNQFEAEFTVNFCRHLIKNGVERSQVTILTLYSGQMNLLQRLMNNESLEDVRVCVVDNYQGEENDIILLSLVRSNDCNSIGFLAIENRICVSLSRAKHGLYVLGNFQMLARQNDMWKRICGYLRNKGLLNSYLMLFCQNHRDKRFQITSPEDFYKYPEGGCGEICLRRMECGHACKKACHFLDKEHLSKCFERCTRSCKNGHSCRLKCWEDCNECDTKVEKIIPVCNHRQLVSCRKDPKEDDCRNRCERILPCRHQCVKMCREKCDNCVLKIEKVSPWCGHSGEYNCSDTNFQCKIPCESVLGCTHKCKGTCGSCSIGRLHSICQEDCKRSLTCGHGCISKCSLSCPPCLKSCEEQCSHNRCSLKCGENCNPCLMKCQWKCMHQNCDKLCYEICERTVCNKICDGRPCCIKCRKRFECYGICGEICARMCLSCDPGIKTTFFGTEDREGARFITLQTCGHSFEVRSMDNYMNVGSRNGEILTKKCPRCNTIINKRSCFRYSNLIKRISSDIKVVRNKVNDKIQAVTSAEYLKKLETRYRQISELFRIYGVSSFYNKTERLNAFMVTVHNTSLDLMFEVYQRCYPRSRDEGTEYTDWCIRQLLLWLNPKKRIFNEYEMVQFNAEFGRIGMLIQIDENREALEYHLNTKSDFIEELKTITFIGDVSVDFTRRWNKFLEKANLQNMSSPKNNKRQNVAANDLGNGRWFKCPDDSWPWRDD